MEKELDVKDIAFTRVNKLVGEGVKEFSIGTKFSAFLTYESKLLFQKTMDFLNPVDKSLVLVRENVKQFSTNSRNLIYLTKEGIVIIVFFDPNLEAKQLLERPLEYTIQKPVSEISVSYMYMAMKRDFQEGEIPNELAVYHLGDVGFDQVNVGKRIEQVPLGNSPIEQVCIGANTLYALSPKHEVFQCDLTPFALDAKEPVKLQLIRNEFFMKKEIKKIYGNFNYFLALEREELESIESWTSEQVLAWLEEREFKEIKNVIKFGNIQGKDLYKADKKYLRDTLGILNENMQSKFFTEISKYSKKTLSAQWLYGWGSNQYGQLGLPPVNLVHIPTKLAIPPSVEKDEIEKIECGYKVTMILTKSHDVWVSFNPQQEKSGDKVKSSDKKSHGSKDEKQQSRKEEKKKSPKEKEEKKKRFRWVNISHQAKKLK